MGRYDAEPMILSNHNNDGAEMSLFLRGSHLDLAHFIRVNFTSVRISRSAVNRAKTAPKKVIFFSLHDLDAGTRQAA